MPDERDPYVQPRPTIEEVPYFETDAYVADHLIKHALSLVRGDGQARIKLAERFEWRVSRTPHFFSAVELRAMSALAAALRNTPQPEG